jgi:fermentation-respiration switch protein FrsA (DUF1100 family)
MRLLILILAGFLGQACSHVFYQPSARHYVDPAKFNLKYEDVYFRAEDGTRLHGWFFPARSGTVKGTVVQFHGNAQNISTHFYSLVWLLDRGYNLFTFDYRGYAKSEGRPSQTGIYLDALAAIDRAHAFHRERGGGKFVIYGQSTGGAISLRALPDWKERDRVDLVVMDSAFSSYQAIAFDKLYSRWFLWPFSPLVYLLISDAYAADAVFDRVTRPLLVITGARDEIVPAKFGKVIYEGVASRLKWHWKLATGAHIDAYFIEQGAQRERFVRFLDEL